MPHCCRTIITRSLSCRSKSLQRTVASSTPPVTSNVQSQKQIEESSVKIEGVLSDMTYYWQLHQAVPLLLGDQHRIRQDINLPSHFALLNSRYFSTRAWNHPPFHGMSSHRGLAAVPEMDPVEVHASIQSEDSVPDSKKSRLENDNIKVSQIHRISSHELAEEINYQPGISRTKSPSRQRSLKILERDSSAFELESNVRRLRQWEFTDVGLNRHLSTNKPGLEFSLMSYNVLAQCLLEDNFNLYEHCDQEVLNWDYRKYRILKELKAADIDILCLQEVQSDHYDDFFLPALTELGYEGTYKKRTGNKNDGCAVFFKASKFNLKNSVSVEFCKPGIAVLDRDNIALVITLTPKTKSGKVSLLNSQICVANTHLLFNPGRGDIKLAQLRILLAEIDKIAFRCLSPSQKPLYHPVIVCGDLNSQPNGDIYRFMDTGALRYEGLVAGDISGQAEGCFRGRFSLTRELVPQALGISDQCQYTETLSQRMGAKPSSKEGTNCDTTGESDVDDKPQCQNTDISVNTHDGDAVIAPSIKASFSSGKMTHRLNLESTYSHHLRRRGNKLAVTTHHRDRSCMVDYIFYSVDTKKVKFKYGRDRSKYITEGPLSLLATYGLLSDKELRDMGGIPNGALPSDHLPLIAKFLLSDR